MNPALAALTLAACMAPAYAETACNDAPRSGDKQYAIAASEPLLAVAAMASAPRPASGAWAIASLPKAHRVPWPARTAGQVRPAESLRAWLAWSNHTLAGE